jgi:dienelactone hydrolase
MVEREIRVRTAAGDMTIFAVHPRGDGPFPIAILYMDGVGYREQVSHHRVVLDQHEPSVPSTFVGL